MASKKKKVSLDALLNARVERGYAPTSDTITPGLSGTQKETSTVKAKQAERINKVLERDRYKNTPMLKSSDKEEEDGGYFSNSFETLKHKLKGDLTPETEAIQTKAMTDPIMDRLRKTSAVAQLSPIPPIRLAGMVVNSAVGLSDAYESYQDGDKTGALRDVLYSVPLPNPYKAAASITKLPKAARGLKAAIPFGVGATLGLEAAGAANDIVDFHVSDLEKLTSDSDSTKTKYAMGGKTKRSMDSYLNATNRSTMGAGGLVPAEIEGGEGVEMPGGEYMEAQGPSHEEGGMPMALPEGTAIYSDRLAINGDTMKKRKDAREKVQKRIERAMAKHPDKLRRDTLKRVTENNMVQDEKDMAFQQIASKLYPTMGQDKKGVKMAMGGVMDTEVAGQDPTGGGGMGGQMPWAQIFQGAMQIGTQLAEGEDSKVKNPLITEYSGMRPYAGGGLVWRDDSVPQDLDPYTSPKFTKNMVEMPGDFGAEPYGMSIVRDPIATPQVGARKSMGLTTGDTIGMAGSAFGTLAPLFTTLRNREGDTPNINAFANFGHDALDANESAEDQIRSIGANQQENLRIQRNTAAARNRNSASSVNTVRGLDLMSDMAYADGTNASDNNIGAMIMGNLGQRSGLLNQRDQAVMGGEQTRDRADRMDRDNFYSNIGRDLTNVGAGVQAQGRNMNQAKQREDFLTLLPELSKHGLGIEYDAQGNPIIKKLK